MLTRVTRVFNKSHSLKTMSSATKTLNGIESTVRMVCKLRDIILSHFVICAMHDYNTMNHFYQDYLNIPEVSYDSVNVAMLESFMIEMHGHDDVVSCYRRRNFVAQQTSGSDDSL